MPRSEKPGRLAGLAAGLGIGAAVFAGTGAAWATPDSGPGGDGGVAAAPDRAARPGPIRKAPVSRATRAGAPPAAASRSIAARGVTPAASAAVSPVVSVELPSIPVSKGRAFEVTRAAITDAATNYVAAGGNPADSARFFFGDLAVVSLDRLAEPTVTPSVVRTQLGNLTASGYFGGIWLRDNLRDNGSGIGVSAASPTKAPKINAATLGIKLFDGLAAGLTGAANGPNWLVDAVAHVSVPVLLALYGYNRGYLQVILENPPAGAPSMQNSLSCNGFLACTSDAFPLQIANRYDDVLGKLAQPSTVGWKEMAMWTTLLEGATGAGRSVWQSIAAAGAFSPKSYAALVDLSSAYLMVSKAAVLSSMLAAAEGQSDVGRSSLRLQAGLWMWSGSYFGGLASGAPVGTVPSISVA